MRSTVERGRREVVVLLEPLRAVLARPPLRCQTDNEARPPLAVNRVRQVADVEQDDGGVDEVTRALDQASGLTEAASEPEGDGDEEADDAGERMVSKLPSR